MGEGGAYSLDTSEYLTPDAIKKNNVRRVDQGSVLLSFKLTVGRVKIAGCSMTTNEAIACFASDDKRMLYYIYPYLLSYDFQSLGSTSSIATAVNSKTIKKMPMAIPSMADLNSFSEKVEPIYRMMFSNQNQIAILNRLRDTLLPKLISGEIDVSQVELGS